MINYSFWPTILSVEPLAQCVVCLSVVCDVLYCGKMVRPSKNCLKEWIGNQGQKVDFWVATIFLLPVSPLRPLRLPFLPYFCPYSPAIGTRWYKWTFAMTTTVDVRCGYDQMYTRNGQEGRVDDVGHVSSLTTLSLCRPRVIACSQTQSSLIWWYLRNEQRPPMGKPHVLVNHWPFAGTKKMIKRTKLG